MSDEGERLTVKLATLYRTARDEMVGAPDKHKFREEQAKKGEAVYAVWPDGDGIDFLPLREPPQEPGRHQWAADTVVVPCDSRRHAELFKASLDKEPDEL
jgi:hypothetical protein